MIHRVLVREEGGQVEHDLRPLEEHPLQLDLVEDVPLDEHQVRDVRDVPAGGGGKVVEDENPGSLSGEPGHEIGADGPGAAGDQDRFPLI